MCFEKTVLVVVRRIDGRMVKKGSEEDVVGLVVGFALVEEVDRSG